MTCKEFDDYLNRPAGEPAPPEFARHLESCPGCRLLLRKLELTNPQPSPVSGISRRFAAELVSNLEPVRPLPRTGYLLLACLTAALLVCIWGVWMWGFSGWQAQTVSMRVFLIGSLAAAMTISAYGLTTEMIPGSRKLVPLAFGLGVPFAVFLATAVLTYHRKYPFDLAPANLSCFKLTLLVAVVALPFVYVSIRRGALLNRFTTAVQVAVLVSIVSLLVLTIYCPILALSHLFIGHLGAVALIWIVGIAAGKALR